MTHLFWTGGWDSTFRLLYLILKEKKQVQPHYIVTSQKSTGKEIATMYSLRKQINTTYPDSRKLLQPLIFQDVRGVEPNEEISKVYHDIKQQRKINAQYELLARYCHQMNLQIELCIEPYHDYITINYFNSGLIFDDYFFYPLISTNKKKMAKISSENGWSDIMSKTWFCRVPKKGKPCGLCGPCTDILLSGLDSRLPFKPRLIARMQLPFRKLWRDNYKYQDKAPWKYIYKLLSRKI